MNDNIIKMFIGGEEVVSNKEFTINEEMLSASSTILNNCYPASWEESKDYVSNFYYPKDYSKFILGKGNFTYGTDQYSILSVSGETFMQFTTNVEKEWNSFNIYGKTTQETRSGKNLLPTTPYYNSYNLFTVSNDVVTQNNPSSASWAWGYARSIFRTTLPAGTYTLTVFAEIKSTNNNAQFGIWDSNENKIIQSSTYQKLDKSSLTFTINETLTIGVTAKMYDGAWKFQIEKGSTATDYEPYGVMPSPDYPSELVSVGYENLYEGSQDFSGTWNNSQYWITDTNNYDGLVVKKRKEAWNGISKDIQVEKDKIYTFSVFLKSDTARAFTIYTQGGTATCLPQSASFTSTTEWKKYSFTFTATASGTVRLRVENTSTSDTNYTYICGYQLTKGTQTHTYIPYGKYGIEVKATGKNLLEPEIFKMGYYLDANYNEVSAGQNAVSQFIRVESNTTYSITGSYYSAGICFYDENKNGINRIGSISGNTITTSSNTKYVRIWIRVSNSVNATLELLKSVTPQFEKGEATTYEEYKETVQLYVLDNPLRSIGDIKDLLYIKNGMLYVDRKIGSVILDGSESTWGLGGNNRGFTLTGATEKFTNRNISIYNGNCNYFNVNKTSTTWTTVNYCGWNTINTFWIREDGKIASTVSGFKSWLSTHNTEVQYVLNEPYTEEVGQVLLPNAYNGINNIIFDTGIDTEETIYYYWKNYDVLFAGIVKNSGDISLRPTNPKYCSLQILDYKTFLSESDTLDFVISDKTIAEAISMVVDAISGYGFVLGTINISQADDIIGAYSTLNKTAYDVFQYLANISGSRWRARFVDSDTMAIDFYDPELLPRANDIDYTQQYWEDNKIVDLTFNYGTRDYRNKQIILSDEVYGGIDYTEVLLSNGYGTSYITQNNIATITSITVNGVEAEVITQSEKDLGVDADFYYTPGKNVVESTTSYTAGTQIIITYTPLVKGRQIVYNDEEVTRIATQTNTTGVISRYENRNDILSSDELENIAESYIKYKGKPEIILKLTTLNNDLFNIGEICYFNSPIADLAQDYMVKSKATNYTSVAGETNIFYTYELTSSFNSEKAINYFDNQRNKATGNIAEGESITRNIDINNSAMIIWEKATITEISVSVDGDNALNSVLNSPFIQ